MAEINLLENYPKSKRDPQARAEQKTPELRAIARRFDKEFFDGDRKYGYGGYNYNPRFWQPVVPTFQEYYGLMAGSKVLDVGCGKGFMMHDFAELIPGIEIKGIDISQYAIDHALDDMKPHVQVAHAKSLPFPDKSFDLVLSINTIHNLAPDECQQALREITRVAKTDAFVTVDAYHNEEERKMMDMWNLTALTYMHVDEWKEFFKKAGYEGDYYWFIP